MENMQDKEIDPYIFRKSKDGKRPTKKVDAEHIERISAEEWLNFVKFWDFTPSWQNSIDSINAVPEVFQYSVVRIDGRIVGYGIVDKKSGDVPQIAVDKEYRGRGIGISVLADLMEQTEAKYISVLNVEVGAEGVESFLHKTGFKKRVNQHEMLLTIV